ncbi:hypothetical protein CLAIMM_12413 [Cladophialophora immunda]|nr:hypothetical protein CLAIMM_12413 [Cladophialophora immunda]
MHNVARRTQDDTVSTTAWESSNEAASEDTAWHDSNDNFMPQATSRISAEGMAQDAASQFFAARRPAFSDPFPAPTSSTFDANSVACRRMHATMLNGLLWDIYFKVFELRFAIWLGNSCRPYLDFTPKPKASIIQLILELDGCEDFHGPSSQKYLPHAPNTLLDDTRKSVDAERMMNDALLTAIYAYAVRWLPLQSAYRNTDDQGASECQSREQDVRSYMWRQAKQAILHALTRPSYRSILALLLFTSTEMPTEDDDPGFVQLCNQALFSHLHILRSPVKWQAKTLSPNQLAASSSNDRVVWCVPEDGNAKHNQEPDNVFWLCVVFGCSRALLRLQPSFILLGNSGDEQVWKFIRERTVIFDQSFGTLKGSQTPLTPDIAETVLQHATACKTMYIGVITQLCDSLFHHKLLPVEIASQAVIDEAQRFHDVFDHLLAMCARDYMFLTSESQLNYLLLVTHYHLASLILADILDSQDTVSEHLKNPVLSRSTCCQAIVNVLSLVLTHDRHSTVDDFAYGSKLLLDPSPELMAEVLLRTGNAILVMHTSGEISTYTTQTMLSIIFSASTIVSEISRKAALVLSILRQACAARNLKVFEEDPRCTLRAPTTDLAVLAACNLEAVSSFLQEMEVQSALHASNLNNMVKLYEEKWIYTAQS